MALTHAERAALIQAPAFRDRIKVSITKYAVYLKNLPTTGARLDWASLMLSSPTSLLQEVDRLGWYILENVAAALALVAVPALDSAADDDAIQGEAETQINATYPTA